MKRMPKKKKPFTAEQIARMADRGEDISRFFSAGVMMNPIQRVNVDFTATMLKELDQEAADLNISRQAVIKTLVREGLDRRIPRRRASEQMPQRGVRAQRHHRTATK